LKTTIDHDTIESLLKDAGVEISASEAHGVATGLISGNFDTSLRLMTGELLDENAPSDTVMQDCKRELTQMHGLIHEQLMSDDFEFKLLLPPDARGMQQRADALVQWCQGFMYGFGVSAKETDRKLSNDAQEALQDIGEFTRLDTLAVSEDDDEEQEALTELEEYMRVAVMTIYQDMLS
jgi:yecA family protein